MCSHRIRSLVAIGLACSPVFAAPKLTPLLKKDAMPGWEQKGGKGKTWDIEDGVLHCTGGHEGGWWGSKEDYTDFVIEFEFKLPPGGNSGLYIRAPKTGDPTFDGMEVQLLDDYAPVYKDILPGQHCGSLYKIEAPSKQVLKHANEWNKMRVEVVGSHVVVHLNGEKIVDADGKSHPEILKRSAQGPVGFQNHSTGLWIRNIKFADVGKKSASNQTSAGDKHQ